MIIQSKEITNPTMQALISLTVECQQVINELGEAFEQENKSFMDALRAAQDVVNNAMTTGEGL